MFKFNFDVCDENIGSKEKVDNDPESSNEKSRKCKNKTIIKICVNLKYPFPISFKINIFTDLAISYFSGVLYDT